MAFIIKKIHKQSELPDEGEHLAVLADIIDLGPVMTEFGMKDRVRFIWLVEQRDADGNQITVPHSYNISLHEQSNLGKVIRIILRRDPGDSFDLDTLPGSNMRLVIEHQTHDGRTFAGIAAMIRPRKGQRVLAIPADYIRAKDRNGGGNGSSGTVATKVIPPRVGMGVARLHPRSPVANRKKRAEKAAPSH